MAGLVTKLGDWEFSSYRDFTGSGKDILCDKEKAIALLQLTPLDFREEISPIDDEKIKKLYQASCF